MCGIAGVLAREPLDDSLPARLDAGLAHRGPDGHDVSVGCDGRLLLVHRRLAIIDPTAAASQPMRSADGRYSLTYNGEIYNFRELRAELCAEGVRFTTQSDTEVLLALV